MKKKRFSVEQITSVLQQVRAACRSATCAARSGSPTTGPPKRVPLSYESFERTIAAVGVHYSSDGTR